MRQILDRLRAAFAHFTAQEDDSPEREKGPTADGCGFTPEELELAPDVEVAELEADD